MLLLAEEAAPSWVPILAFAVPAVIVLACAGERAVDEPDRTVGLVLSYPMPAVTRSGVVGRPTAATAERGAELVEQLVEALAELLKRARAESDPDLSPP